MSIPWLVWPTGYELYSIFCSKRILKTAICQALSEFSAITTPGAFLVDMLPALKYVPDWFPGYVFPPPIEIHINS